ncbi:MAG: TIGR04255 family protein [Chloroflexi bacterium]|nr:TIGR04255 family protein [Chloroflexota bacterium]OJV97779.1 MAG: hypothetical protein BGO39_07625 [Chloroflexi bacterium 54-19]
MGEQYANPPLIEAFCQFNFEQDTDWDATMPGLVFNQLKDEGFTKKKQANKIGFEIQVVGNQSNPQLIPVADRVQFYNEEETALFQVGPYFLAINVLKPYPSWITFKDLISKGLQAYLNVTEAKTFKTVSLRYINDFEFEGINISLEKNFDFRPHFPQGFPENYGPFLLGSQFNYDEGQNQLQIQLTTVENGPDKTKLRLDLVYATQNLEGLKSEEILNWLELAHDRIEFGFEHSLKEDLKRTFGIKEG